MEGKRGLQYLDSLERWSGKGEFTLEPLRRVLKQLGDPQDSLPLVHVGGTNGKGSTCAAVASILGAFGKRVGLTISPHLTSPRERIVLDGEQITYEFLNDLAVQIMTIAQKGNETLTYHECLTALSFLAFKEWRAEYGVVEVGLGGRLDASNVIKRPAVTAITSIGFDHVEVLGSTIEAISAEKSGILKKGTPLITGDLQPAALKVIGDRAKELSIAHKIFQKDFSVSSDGEIATFENSSGLHFNFTPALLGEHQLSNMGVASEVASMLGVDSNSIKKGIESVFWPGRLEKLSINGRTILLDCAHNWDGVVALKNYVRRSPYRELTLVFGALDTKDWKGMVDELSEISNNWIVFEPRSDRAVPSSLVVDYLSSIGIKGEVGGREYHNIINDINMLNEIHTVLITGSIYLIGELRPILGGKEKKIWERKEI